MTSAIGNRHRFSLRATSVRTYLAILLAVLVAVIAQQAIDGPFEASGLLLVPVAGFIAVAAMALAERALCWVTLNEDHLLHSYWVLLGPRHTTVVRYAAIAEVNLSSDNRCVEVSYHPSMDDGRQASYVLPLVIEAIDSTGLHEELLNRVPPAMPD